MTMRRAVRTAHRFVYPRQTVTPLRRRENAASFLVFKSMSVSRAIGRARRPGTFAARRRLHVYRRAFQHARHARFQRNMSVKIQT
ncbi:hypothetical protein WS69_21990 [Burkholderia sp. BDU5]|nr:hypothetical protein WS69_21990 [Burkholderia sp. BDU5]